MAKQSLPVIWTTRFFFKFMALSCVEQKMQYVSMLFVNKKLEVYRGEF